MLLDSGTLTVWRGENVSPPGGKPKLAYTQVWGGCYGLRTVGITRWYTAQQHGDRSDLLVRVQRTYAIDPSQDLVLLAPYDHQDSGAYKITLKQDVLDEDGLPATDLTLERSVGIDAGTIAESSGGIG